MKKVLVAILFLLIILAAGTFIFYKFYLPQMVAKAILEEEKAAYVPKFIEARLQKYKEPINNGADDVIHAIHKHDVTLEQLLQAIDNTSTGDINSALNEIRESDLKTSDQLFDIAKKYVKADFDVEVLREPFRKNIKPEMIRKGQKLAQVYGNEAFDPLMAKAVLKKVLIQKEKEFYQRTSQ